MANTHFQCAFVAVAFFTFLNLGACLRLRCFHCTEVPSEKGEICKNPLNHTLIGQIRECSGSEVCINHQTPSVWNMPEKIVRDCGYPDYCETTAKQIERTIDYRSIHCSVCTEDLCNSASTLTTPVLISIALYFIINH